MIRSFNFNKDIIQQIDLTALLGYPLGVLMDGFYLVVVVTRHNEVYLT